MDLEGLIFDYEQYKQRWPDFWLEGAGFRLFALAFSERIKINGTLLINYIDFMGSFKRDFEFEIGPYQYSFLTLSQRYRKKADETAIKRMMLATPCTLETDPLHKRRGWKK